MSLLLSVLFVRLLQLLRKLTPRMYLEALLQHLHHWLDAQEAVHELTCGRLFFADVVDLFNHKLMKRRLWWPAAIGRGAPTGPPVHLGVNPPKFILELSNISAHLPQCLSLQTFRYAVHFFGILDVWSSLSSCSCSFLKFSSMYAKRPCTLAILSVICVCGLHPTATHILTAEATQACLGCSS